MSICEICPSETSEPIKYMGMLMCPDCYQKELDLQNASKLGADTRVTDSQIDMSTRLATAKAMAPINIVIAKSEEIDGAITRRTDIFNAETVSIIDICAAIDSDDAITNKPFIKAETLLKRFEHFKKVIFDKQQEIVDDSNKAQAIQTYLNNLANTLRVEERERLKLVDINYQPSAKPVKVKKISTKSNVVSNNAAFKEECKRVALQMGVGENVIRQICVARNCNPQIAAQVLSDISKSVTGQ